MKMTKTQLKEAVKAVVRECLNERIIKEVSPPGDKAERMIHHVKASLRKSHPDWSEEKVTSVAIATGWKAHNKGSVEQDECGTMEEGADSKVSVIDDIVRFVLRKVPAIKGNPDKIARVAALLFHHQFGRVADGQAVMDAVERNLGYEDQVADTPVSQTPKSPKVAPAEEGGSEEEEESKGSEEQEESHEEEEEESKSEVNEAKGKARTLPPNKGQYKVVAPKSAEETEENKALTIQSDPEVNESANTLPPNKGQYKTVAPHQYTTTDQNKPLTIQSDPKVNEGPIKMSNVLKEKWKDKNAVNPAHKGYCTPMTKSTCTPRRKAFAKRAKAGWPEEQAGMQEAGLTSETPEVPPTMPTMEVPPLGAEAPEGGAPEGGEGYDEREEIKLIKVIGKAAERLEDMHAGMPGDEEEPEIPIKKEFPSKPLDDTEPKKPSKSPEKKEAPKGKGSEGDKKDKKKDKDVDENHRVQVRSYVTVNDNPNDPNKMRDPENPQSNGA